MDSEYPSKTESVESKPATKKVAKKEVSKKEAPAKKSEASQASEDMAKLKEHIRMVGVALGDPVEGEHKNLTERRAWANRVVELLGTK